MSVLEPKLDFKRAPKIVIIGTNKHYNTAASKRKNGQDTSTGWTDNEFVYDEKTLSTLFSSTGVNMCTLYEGKRVAAATEKINGLMLDFEDGNMTEELVIKEQKSLGCASYAFGSINHKANEKYGDRLRLYIPFKAPLIEVGDHSKLERILHKKYRGDIDKTCTERARYFFHGNTEAFCSFVDGDFLDWEAYIEENYPKLETLIDFTKVGKALEAGKKVSYYKLSDKVTTADGKTCLISDLIVGTEIVCPTCGFDKSRGNVGEPNARYDYSSKSKDEVVIFCFSCKDRGNGSGGEGVYNLHKDDAFKKAAEKTGALSFIDVDTDSFYGIETINNKLKIISLGSGGVTLNQFNKRVELPTPEIYPAVEYKLFPEKDDIVNLEERYVNKYIASDVLKAEIPDGYVAKLPKYIGLLIDHVIGHDAQIKPHYYNNMAYFIQTRKKMITAYLFQGTEGTGKGFLFDLVWSKILGEDYCTQASQDAFTGRFNKHLSTNVFMQINEASVNFSARGEAASTKERIKMAITDHKVGIEGKGDNLGNGTNHSSFCFTTNEIHALHLKKGDRRFNICPRQEVMLVNAPWYRDDLEEVVTAELQEFVWYLKQIKVNVPLTKRVIDNEPKRLLQEISKTNQEHFFEALADGNLAWFEQNLVRKDGDYLDSKYDKMVRIKLGLRDPAQKDGKPSCVQMEDLRQLYCHINNKIMGFDQFKILCDTYNFKAKTVKVGGNQPWGVPVVWK